MRPIETVDASRPRASGGAAAFARAELRRAREARHYGLTPVVSVVVVVVLATAVARTQDIAPERPSDGTDASAATLADAQREFYSGRYEAAAELSVGLCAAGAGDLGDLEACELRTSSLHFQIRRAMGDAPDRERAWTMCAICPDLMSSFLVDTDRARPRAGDASAGPQRRGGLVPLGKD
jgi:hypothetical protein